MLTIQESPYVPRKLIPSFTFSPQGKPYQWSIGTEIYSPTSGLFTHLRNTQDLSEAVIEVVDASSLPSNGSVITETINLQQTVIAYTGKTSNTLTGCSGGFGTGLDGTKVDSLGNYLTGVNTPITFTATVKQLEPYYVWPTRYKWDFGDGTSATGLEVQKTYLSSKEGGAGVRVTFTVWDNLHRKASVAQQLMFEYLDLPIVSIKVLTPII